MNESRISFNGFLIIMSEDREEDCIKIYHDAYPPGTWDPGSQCQGKLNAADSLSIDISPYSSSIEDCCAVIELGFPTRKDVKSVGPLSHEEIGKLWFDRFGNTLPDKFAFSILQ